MNLLKPPGRNVERENISFLIKREYISSAPGYELLSPDANRMKGEQGDVAFAKVVGDVKELFESASYHSIFKGSSGSGRIDG